jgi:hypothetical protein
MKQKVIVLVAMILSAIAGALVPLVVASLLSGPAFLVTMFFPGSAEPGPDPRAEYYRAMYDVCVYQTRQPEMCLKAVAGNASRNWYEDPSPGWEWPLPDDRRDGQPTPTPRPQRDPASQRLNG